MNRENPEPTNSLPHEDMPLFEESRAGNSAPARWGHRIPLVALLAVLAAPILYLTLHRSSSPNSSASPTVNRAADLPALESTSHAAPTAGNKLNLAAEYINQQQSFRAVPLLDSILVANPHNAVAWNNYCVVHVQQQDLAAAVEACNRAIASDPKLELARNNLKWAEAEEAKARSILRADEATPLASRPVDMDLRDGLAHLHLGEYDAALVAFQAMASRDPKSSVAANNIGTAYMMKHDAARAIPWFDKALALDPASQLARNNLAWANAERGKS